MKYIIPIVILTTILFGCVKKISVYDSFVEGVKESISLSIGLLPYLATIFMMLEVFRISGLSEKISDTLAIPLSYLGIPKELTELLILRPLSGSGSLAVVEEIFSTYGADSYVGKCASVIMASNDTIFYISAVYLSKSKEKDCSAAIVISIVCSLFSAIISCLLCKVF